MNGYSEYITCKYQSFSAHCRLQCLQERRRSPLAREVAVREGEARPSEGGAAPRSGAEAWSEANAPNPACRSVAEVRSEDGAFPGESTDQESPGASSIRYPAL